MLTVLVSIRVKPEYIAAFTKVTIEDVRASLKDAGVIRFDLIQQSDDPAHFILNEVYHAREDGVHHLETEHQAMAKLNQTDARRAPACCDV